MFEEYIFILEIKYILQKTRPHTHSTVSIDVMWCDAFHILSFWFPFGNFFPRRWKLLPYYRILTTSVDPSKSYASFVAVNIWMHEETVSKHPRVFGSEKAIYYVDDASVSVTHLTNSVCFSMHSIPNQHIQRKIVQFHGIDNANPIDA